MRNFRVSPLALCTGAVGVLLVVYIGLIAVVMSYASLTIEFSQFIKNDESGVAVLEAQYLSSIREITTIDYIADGYTTPLIKSYVPAKSGTALR
jgi:hypothetical protein